MDEIINRPLKILITGGNGFLGQHLSLFLKNKNFDVVAAGRNGSRLPISLNIPFYSIDFVQLEEVKKMLHILQPNVIVHTAAISKPDDCEKNKEECLLQNVKITELLVKNFEKLDLGNKHFIFTSTDFVFGEGGPHSEEDLPAPLNFYGESKLLAEQVVKKFSQINTIVRPVFIYGQVWEGLRPSFLHWVKSNLEQGKRIKVVNDQLRTPTYVEDICEGIYKIIKLKKGGIYHLAGKDILSPFQMALQVAQMFNLDKSLIESVTSDTFPEPVKRSKHSGLKIQKAIKEINYKPQNFKNGIKLSLSCF